MVDVNTSFTLIAGIIFIGFLALKAFDRFKVPDILILMILGVAIGPLFGVVDATTISSVKELSPLFGTLVLVILLVEGGMSLNYQTVLKEAASATLFTVTAFFGSVVVVAGAAMAFGWTPLNGLLLGVILGGNSSSVVMTLVKKLSIKEETKTVLSLESSLNDALVIIFAIMLIQVITAGGVQSFSQLGQDFFSGFTTSAFFAIIAGLVWIKALNKLNTPKYNYLLTLAVVLLLYVFTEGVKSNGAFAALVFGIMLGNARAFTGLLGIDENVVVQSNLHGSQEEITFFVRTFFFVFLGLLLDPKQLALPLMGLAVVIISAKSFARYWAASVLARFGKDFEADKTTLAVMLPNGLAAAAMAAYPATAGITFNGEDLFLQVAFLVIFLSNIFASVAVFVEERKKVKRAQQDKPKPAPAAAKA